MKKVQHLCLSAILLFCFFNSNATHFSVTALQGYFPGSFSYEMNSMNADLTSTNANPHVMDVCVGGPLIVQLNPSVPCIINFPKDMHCTNGAVNYFNAINNPTHVVINNLVINDRAGNSYGHSLWIGTGGKLTVTMNNCIFRNNTEVDNGPIFNNGDTLIFNGCSFYDNSTGIAGGVMNINGGYTRITNSTFSNNSCASTSTLLGGGAILAGGGRLEVFNSTFYNNRTGKDGGAINSGPAATVNITNCLFVGNTATGTGPDVKGIFGSAGGHNLFSDNTGATLNGNTTGNINGAVAANTIDIVLRDNGHYMMTHAVIQGSAALNTGNDTYAPLLDQRDYARWGVSEIGSFEYNGINPCAGFAMNINPVIGCAPNGQQVSYTLTGGATVASSYWLKLSSDYFCGATTPYTGGGTYIATATDVYGCVAKDTFISTYNPTIYNQTRYLCAGHNFQVGDSVYTVSGTYTSYIGCDSAVVSNLLDANDPIVTTNYNNVHLNCTQTTELLWAYGADYYGWSNGSGTQFTIIASIPGTVTVVGTDATTGCTASASVNVTVDTTTLSVTITADFDTLTCISTPTLTATPGVAGTYLYQWSSGNGGADISTDVVTNSGSHSVTVTNNNTCETIASYFIVDNAQPPVITFTPPNPNITCVVDTPTVTASGGTSYLWNTGETTATINNYFTGTYGVTVTDSHTGCTGVNTVNVGFDLTTPTITMTVSNQTLTCANPTSVITATGGGTYLWSNGATSDSITVGIADCYVVTVSETNTGCTAQMGRCVQDNLPPQYENTVPICPGSSIMVNGNTYSTAGVYTDHFACDSTVVTTVVIDSVYTPSVTVSAMSSYDLTQPFNPAYSNDIYDSDNIALNAFDGDSVNYGWGSDGGLPNTILQYNYGAGHAVALTSYSIYNSCNQQGGWCDEDYNPKTWTFVGSNNGTTWTTLDSITDGTLTIGTLATFNFTNSTAYQYYRINITADEGADEPRITEFYLAGANGKNPITASDFYDGDNLAVNAFDNDTTHYGWANEGNGLPSWLAYNFGTGNSKVVNAYSIYNSCEQEGGWCDDGYNPSAWAFQASNNDTTWITLDTVASASIVIGTKSVFQISNPTAYRKYRLYFTNSDDGDYVRVTEVELLQNLLLCDNHIFGADASSAGSNPVFQWKVNGTLTGNGNNPEEFVALSPGDAITCVVTSSNQCNTSPTATSAIVRFQKDTRDTFALTVCKDSLIVHGVPVSISGTYIDTLHTAGGCDSILVLNLTVLQICPTGIENIGADAMKMKLLPNPNNGLFTLEFNEAVKHEIQITNIIGSVLTKLESSAAQLQFDLSNEPSGVYFVSATQNGQKKQIRFVIQR